ncbi:D-glycero-alpha-D-manno-heptose-1,7-bisphosphate 7-phosphatase [Thermomonas carbonis]|uniref:D,D-heptose 1,7-bisphosphate phosphatase n=1 Tax=Thermomonas carbonis TaxID=1463158 RepID=A0A7G9SU76_9GAMM|nr:HAD family hydrolase [Thermomonas carbonis]QNN71401.1 HAD family hydrolase [Thermomonas carbonis]GHC09827.1 D,D-heptose 1,7-bisphosphate phosphatase [Thermomonas carbonis]
MSTAHIRAPYMDPSADAQLASLPVPRKALFLDRDGVVNINHGYVHTPANTDWVPGIFELVADAHARGYLPIVVTNQAGIGRGLYDEVAFLAYTAWMHAQFAARNTPLLATFWCPHHPDAGNGDYRADCMCRKPAPGMLLDAIARYGIDPAQSSMIGDKQGDLEAAAAAGVPARLLHEQDWGSGLAGMLSILS